MKKEGKNLNELDFTNDEDFEYYLDNILDEPEAVERNASDNLKQKQTTKETPKTMETELKELITKLEKTIEGNRNELKREFSAETLKKINNDLAELEKLKETHRYETQLREKYFKMFDGKMTESDFMRLWESSLRDEALKADTMEKQNALNLAKRHSIYKTW